MSGLCRLDCNFSSLEVSNLSDHDYIRVLTEERSQRRRKGQSRFRVHLNLVYSVKVDFNRVLGGGDIGLVVIKEAETRIKRNGLSRAGRSGYQDKSLRAVERVKVFLFLDIIEAELVDIEFGRRRVEDSHYDFLAPESRQRVDTEIDSLLRVDLELDSSVLRQSPLGDIKLRHNLHTRGKTLG